MKRSLAVLVSWLGLALISVAHGAEPRIAVVDLAQVLQKHPDTKSAEALLQMQVEEFEQEQKELLAKGEKLKEEFETVRKEAENKALSEAVREEKLGLAREKLIALKEHEQKLIDTSRQRRREISDQEQRLRKRILDKIRDVIQEYAKKKQIALVLDSSAAGAAGVEAVVYAEQPLDITSDIIRLVTAAEGKKEASGEKNQAQ
ncbi:MAG: OmpH family outer membrane protein [Kiritimatiellia bacterium]